LIPKGGKEMVAPKKGLFALKRFFLSLVKLVGRTNSAAQTMPKLLAIALDISKLFIDN
jgi:hypothetical protein